MDQEAPYDNVTESNDNTAPSTEMEQQTPDANIGDDEEPLKTPSTEVEQQTPDTNIADEEEPLKTPSTELEQQTPDTNIADDEGGRTDNMPSPEAAPLKMSTDSTEHVTINIGLGVPSNPPTHLHVATTSELPTFDDGPSSTAESVTDSRIGRSETMGASEKERKYIE